MAATKIMFTDNGSIRVEGDFELVDPAGSVIDLVGRTRIGLCRCGHSANKPFCDGSHKVSGFQSVIVAADIHLPAPKPPAPNPGP